MIKKDVCIVFPIYPRLPDNTSTECYKMVNILFNDFISKNKVEEVVFMGDSAGGGLALGMAQRAKNSHNYIKENKQKVILLSPWLDMGMSDPLIDDIQPYDYQLSKVGLTKLGKIWANGDTKSSEASPLYGDVDCGPISIFVGTRDILYPNSLQLCSKLKEKGIKYDINEFKDMSHCFMLIPMPESNDAMKKIAESV